MNESRKTDSRQQTAISYQQSAVSNQYPRRGERPFAPTTSYWLLGNRGFALISVIIILSLMGIATGVATSFAHRLKSSRRQSATEDELKALKEAILGNPREYSKEGRSGFGYLGDMGGLPAALADLYTKGTQQYPYALGTAGQGAGWAGPYITPILREDLPDLRKDPYGNTYNYTTFTPLENADVAARIRSFGPNKITDGGAGDDKQIEILRKETLSTVSGYVLDSTGAAVSGAQVYLYYPVAGIVSSPSSPQTTDTNGFYSFSNIPFGIRTITVSGSATGTLKFAEGSALATGTGANKNNLNFNVTNWGGSSVPVDSIVLSYTVQEKQGPNCNPTNAWYETVYVGSTPIFQWNNSDVPNYNSGNRRATGNTLTVSPAIPISGGTSSTTKRILVASDNVMLPYIVLYPKGGSTLNFRFLGFMDKQNDAPPPPATKVPLVDDPCGSSFTVTINGVDIQPTNFPALEQP